MTATGTSVDSFRSHRPADRTRGLVKLDLNQQREGRLAYAKKHNNAFTIDLAGWPREAFRVRPARVRTFGRHAIRDDAGLQVVEEEGSRWRGAPGSAEIHRAKVPKAALKQTGHLPNLPRHVERRRVRRLFSNACSSPSTSKAGRCASRGKPHILYHLRDGRSSG